MHRFLVSTRVFREAAVHATKRWRPKTPPRPSPFAIYSVPRKPYRSRAEGGRPAAIASFMSHFASVLRLWLKRRKAQPAALQSPPGARQRGCVLPRASAAGQGGWYEEATMSIKVTAAAVPFIGLCKEGVSVSACSVPLSLAIVVAVLCQRRSGSRPANTPFVPPEPTCSSGSIPLFTSSGGSASVSNSLFTQSGSTVTLSGSQTLSGNLNIASSGTSAGNIVKGSTLFLHSFGSNNVFLGPDVKGNLTMGYSANNNTAVGTNALPSLTTGCCNTAAGNNALLQNSSGGGNTAMGDGALYSNSTGSNNTGIGRWVPSATPLATSTPPQEFRRSRTTPPAYKTLPREFMRFSKTRSARETPPLATVCCSRTPTVPTTPASDRVRSRTTVRLRAHKDMAAAMPPLGPLRSFHNSTGNVNTATGYYALLNNTSGNDNTAVGHIALTPILPVSTTLPSDISPTFQRGI